MQLMPENPGLRFELSRQLEDRPVVSEKQDLSLGRELREDFEADPCAVVIKSDENVVDDKGHGLAFAQVLLEGRKAQ